MSYCKHKLPNGEFCYAEAQTYVIQGYEPPLPRFDLCSKHAAEFGFCLSCGAFIGGTEDVFLTGKEGLCFECFSAEQREIDRMFADQEDDDREWED